MTDQPNQTLIDDEQATDPGAQGLAAADLASQVMRLLHQALDASELDQKSSQRSSASPKGASHRCSIARAT